jgi:hypothetical protein
MNNRYKVWIVLSLVAVFAIGLAAGYFGERYIVHKAFHRGRPHFPTVESLAKDLGLTKDQQDRIRKIFEGNEARLKAFGDDFHKRMDDLRGQLKREVDAVLTQEQIGRLEAMIKEYIGKDKAQKDKSSGDSSRPQDKGDMK